MQHISKLLLLILAFFSLSISTTLAQEGIIGEIRLFAGNFAPRGWALCQGQLLPISQNTPLFAVIGTTYGGNGHTTFGLPDLSGRVAIGQGSGPGLSGKVLGEIAGVENITLTQDQMPTHLHSLNVLPAFEIDFEKEDFTPQKGNKAILTIGNEPNTTFNNPPTANSGSNKSANNMQPYLTINYIICVEGMFPSRP